MILNAHSSQINCLTSVSGQLFATGALKEIKLWKCFECVHVIATAHSNAIITLKMMRFGDGGVLLASGSKDKQMKLWGNVMSSNGEWGGVVGGGGRESLSEMTLSHYSQVNTFE